MTQPMTRAELEAAILAEGYGKLRWLPDGRLCGIKCMIFTSGLFVGLTLDGYASRYCYELYVDARTALMAWDGTGDPPGLWIVVKPEGRMGPGAELDAQ